MSRQSITKVQETAGGKRRLTLPLLGGVLIYTCPIGEYGAVLAQTTGAPAVLAPNRQGQGNSQALPAGSLQPLPSVGAQTFSPGGAQAVFPSANPTFAPEGAQPSFSEGVAFQRQAAPGASPVGGDSVREGDESGAGWGMAPVRWGGSVGMQVLSQQGSAGSSWTNVTGLFNLIGSTYIYQPWFAQVSGNVGVAATQGTTSSGDGISADNDQSSIVGNLALNLFPVSRFPFLATIDRTDSQVSGSFVTSPYSMTRINLRQGYRSESGTQNGNIGFDWSQVDQRNYIGSDVVGAVYGDYSLALEDQTLQMVGRYSQTNRDFNGENSRLINYFASHNYRFDDNMTLTSNAMYNDNRLVYLLNDDFVSSAGRYMQLSSSASWRPEDEEIPLSVTGGFFFLDTSSSYNSDSGASQSLSGNLSASYNYSSNLLLSANGLVTQIKNQSGGAADGLLTNMGLAANYVGDPLMFGKYSYNWNLGGSVNHMTGVVENDRSMSMVQANHSLTRDFTLTDRQSLQFNFSQGLSQTTDQVLGTSSSFSNTLGSTWRVRAGDQGFGSVGLSYQDMLTNGFNEGRYQFLYLYLNGNAQLSPRSSFSSNVTLQWSRQDTPILVVNPNYIFGATGYYTNEVTRPVTVFGSANYNHSRAFDIQGLRYNLSLNANTQLADSRLYGNAGALPQQYTWWLENRFDYQIGKLTLTLTASVMEIAGKENAQIFLRVTRAFGSY